MAPKSAEAIKNIKNIVEMTALKANERKDIEIVASKIYDYG